MFFMDPTYFIFALPALILAFYAQWRVQSAYKKWLRVANSRGLTACKRPRCCSTITTWPRQHRRDARRAHRPLRPAHKDHAAFARRGNSNSVAAVAVVAHEIGHAVRMPRPIFR